MAKVNRKTDAGADYTDVVFPGGTYVGKMKRGQWPPDPMPRTTSGPYSADPNDEVCGGEAFRFGLPGYGPKH